MRHVEVAHLAPVMLGAVDQLARHHAVLQDAAVAIDVAQEQVERREALLQAGFDPRPFLGGDDARQEVGRDDPLGGLIVAIDGEGDALLQEGLLAGLLAAAQLVGAAASASRPSQRRVVRPHRAVGGEHLVIGTVEHVILVRRIAARPCAPRFGLFYARCHPMLHMRSEA